MSSILDALEKLEATRGPQPPLRPGGAPRRGRRWSVVVLVVVAVVAGAGGAALLLGRGTATEPAPAEQVAARTPESHGEKGADAAAPKAHEKRGHTPGAAAPKREPAHATTPPATPPPGPTFVDAIAAPKRAGAIAPVAPPPAAGGPAPIGTPPPSQNAGATPPPAGAAANPGTAPAPFGLAANGAMAQVPAMNAVVPPVAAAPRTAAPVPAPDPTGHERPWAAEPPAAPKTPPSTAVLAMAREAPSTTPAPAPRATVDPPASRPTADVPAPRATAAEPALPVSPRTPAGAPRMRVSFLVYSSVAERRSVALTFDGGGLTTLREGEESNGVEVVRIGPDRVELRWQGEAFTLEVRS